MIRRGRDGRISPKADVFAMQRRQLERLDLPDGRRRYAVGDSGQMERVPDRPVVRSPELHVCNRGAILPDGSRGCWWCWASNRLGVQP